MLLTDEERAKFIAWLQSEIASDELLLKQMESMPSIVALTKQRRIETMAKQVVLRILEGIHRG